MKTRSGIITLTTDFGLIDPYVAMMKGVILSINPKAIIIDITHHIQVGSILTASSLIRETFPFFPQGSIHVGVVDPTVGSQRRLMGIEAGGHFFVGPDNGLFGPIINDHKDARIIKLENKKYFLPHLTYTFHGREVFAPIAAHLSCGVKGGMCFMDKSHGLTISVTSSPISVSMIYSSLSGQLSLLLSSVISGLRESTGFMPRLSQEKYWL